MPRDASTGVYTLLENSNYPAVPGVTIASGAHNAVLEDQEAGLNVTAGQLQGIAWTDAASASSVDLGAVDASNIRITGTTTISSFGTVRSGITKNIRFAAALTLTYNATSMILPGAASITTAANDTALFVSLGSGNWLCVAYNKAANAPVTYGTGWGDALSASIAGTFYASKYGISRTNTDVQNDVGLALLAAAVNANFGGKIIWPYAPENDPIEFSVPFTFNASNIWNIGLGPRLSLLKYTGTSNEGIILGNDATNTTEYGFEQMGILTVAGGTGVWVRRVTGVTFLNFYEKCDRFIRLGSSAAAGACSKIAFVNGYNCGQITSATVLSHIRYENCSGQVLYFDFFCEGQRQVNTIGEDFSANTSPTIDDYKVRGGYMARFDYNRKQGNCRITNGTVTADHNSEGAGISAWYASVSGAAGGFGQVDIAGTYGTDAQNGSWAASPSYPIHVEMTDAAANIDTLCIERIRISQPSKKTGVFVDAQQGIFRACRVGDISYYGVPVDTSQYVSHIKGGSGSTTIKSFSHGPVYADYATNALAGGIKYEGGIEASEPDAGKVTSGVTYFIDDSHTIPLPQGFRLQIINTAGTLQLKVTGIGDDTNAAKSEFISRFTGFSTSLQNVATGTDSSTAFVGGGKVRSGDPSQFLFDTIAAQTTNLVLPAVRVVRNTTGTAVFFSPTFVSSNVNGVTQNRMLITMYRPSDGTAFGINTTNIASGKEITLDIQGQFV